MKAIKIIFLLLFMSLAFSFVSASDITLTLDQKEYYFLSGEQAIIPIHSESSYEETINGQLSYTVEQEVNQGTFHYSSTNTRSSPLPITPEKQDISINFGTSDTPQTLTIGLKFLYDKEGAKEIVLDEINIYFVADEKQKDNQQSQVSSSSQETQVNSQQQNPTAQEEEDRMQQMIEQMLQQPQQTQTQQERLQNSQMAQDSNALKKEIQELLQEEQRLQEEFQKELGENPEFMKEHQDLLDQGFNLNGGNLDPESNDTGEFELNYQNEKGIQATMKGQLNKGELQNLEKDTPQMRQEMLEQLQQDPRFQKFQEELQNQGFKEQNTEYTREQNSTGIKQNYKNEQNETAAIKAEIANNTVEKVNLELEKKKDQSYWWILPLIGLAILGILFYRRISKKQDNDSLPKPIIVKKPFDHLAESKKLLRKSKGLFEEKKYKDAYGTAAQALRLYLSYENRLNKELTNDDLVDVLKKKKTQYKDVKECFDLCSLVEFAKYKANKKDFDRIVKIVEKKIEK
ncbi:MAG: hypothetical protein KKF44_06895 [Nanoarchaeota archaeon]|nr:hypothetical protein [Nanoarchaeota archaeon]